MPFLPFPPSRALCSAGVALCAGPAAQARSKSARRSFAYATAGLLAFGAMPGPSPAFACALRLRCGRRAPLRALAELGPGASIGLRFRRTRLAASGRRMNFAFVLFGRGPTLAAAGFQTASLRFPILPGHDFGESGLDHSDLRQWCARSARALDANHEIRWPSGGPQRASKNWARALAKVVAAARQPRRAHETTPGSRNYSRRRHANADRRTARGSALSLRHWRD